MYTNYTVDNLISDAKTALKAGAYFSSLALTFALVSECANIEYPNEWFEREAETDEYLKKMFPNNYKDGMYKGTKNHDKERFVMWLDDWNNAHNCDDTIKHQMEEYESDMLINRQTDYGLSPRVNGELLYQLRCYLFHEASTNIDFQSVKISDEGNRKVSSDKSILSIDRNNPFDMHPIQTSYTSSDGTSSLEINVNGIVYYILNIVELYYQQKNGRGFNNIHIYDNR